MEKWDIKVKPPENICPEEFCFLWSESDKKCGLAFGICKRTIPSKANKDLYEPFEPELKKHGLPWFYFIPSDNKLSEELREKYKIESVKLWNE